MKAYKFNNGGELHKLVEKFGKEHFEHVPIVTINNNINGYLLHGTGSKSWTSGTPHYTGIQCISYEDAMRSVTLEDLIDLAKSYIGKGVHLITQSPRQSFTVEKVSVILDKKSARLLNVDSLLVITELDKSGIAVVVTSPDGASATVGDVTLSPTTMSVKLNDDYTAVISKDEIQVGCQTFPISILDELLNAHKSIY
jgi:hypothetical protein